jgi:hypothetical protein
MSDRKESQVKAARGASEEKRGRNPAKVSPEATKMEKSMSQDALRKKATKPGASFPTQSSKAHKTP